MTYWDNPALECLGSAPRAQQQVCPLRLGESGLGAGLPLIADYRALRMTCIIRCLPSDLESPQQKEAKAETLITLPWGCRPGAHPGGFW